MFVVHGVDVANDDVVVDVCVVTAVNILCYGLLVVAEPLSWLVLMLMLMLTGFAVAVHVVDGAANDYAVYVDVDVVGHV